MSPPFSLWDVKGHTHALQKVGHGIPNVVLCPIPSIKVVGLTVMSKKTILLVV